MQSHCTSNANSIAQYATVAALNTKSNFLDEMVKTFDGRRKMIIDFVNSCEGLSCPNPQGAFYVMINISNIFGKSIDGKVIDSSLKAAELMLEYARIAVVPCESFGAPEYVRLSYAISNQDIEKGLKRLKEFLNNLK
jgi:aspartate aminotransferase